MSSLHKFKAYFGMVPLDDYEDDYIDEPEPRRAPRPAREPASYRPEDREFEPSYSAAGYASRRDDADADYDRYERRAPRSEAAPVRPRPAAPGPRPVRASGGGFASRGDGRSPLFDEGGPLSKITTLRPRDYSEARTIGERFRDGTPVIMDLVEMSNADAKRLVDFAAGLAFALRGSFDKVATKVFLLSPADIDVSAEERRRIAETGFYSQK
ncbi:cell division protein SepF [Rhodococcus rhodnii]|uniref:Cell division protein SepF n=2 Tax=Rhodococcus rhodnii TaxID=38312 RepID=R7WS34_9NOCA|nr:cell division protein SepF [Rhodococcus rhodnii]EOM78121.1 hypothetical protein Rrhod_0456 [Rhodococcus rhodnii LMG 5362]TXG91395.1 cell division protein SepF [Rhodococcus rhodnii]